MSKENTSKESLNSALRKTDVSRSLLLAELDRRINWFHEMSKANKGAIKKSYEDTCNSFVLFKIWVEKQ